MNDRVKREAGTATIGPDPSAGPAGADNASDPVVALLEEWLADESGYDEEVWPRLKEALNRERERIGARKLFRD